MMRTRFDAAVLTVLGLVMSEAVPAASLPVFTANASAFGLVVPYLELRDGSGGVQAFAAGFEAAPPSVVFRLTSLAPVPVSADAAQAPQFSATANGFQLSLPRVILQGDGSAHALTLTSSDLGTFAADVDSLRRWPDVGESGHLPAPVIGGVPGLKDASRLSASRLAVSWSAPTGFAPEHYELEVIDVVTAQRDRRRISSDTLAVTLDTLKSDTDYRLRLFACGDADCMQAAASDEATGRTAPETWQLAGAGNTVAGLSLPVADGNARISATRIGPDAGTANADTVQLYYGPQMRPGSRPTLAVAPAEGGADADARYRRFHSLAYASGLVSPPEPSDGSPLQTADNRVDIRQIATGQGVPLASGAMRLFFEAQGSDGLTRIYRIDSQDGYLGVDFHAGPSTVCETFADYHESGCVPRLVLGVDGDPLRALDGVRNVRQHKIGYPTQRDWRWDEAAGTFMVFTVDALPGCSDAGMNHGYAVLQPDGEWQVSRDDTGCPTLFRSAQACFPMHLGASRYKLVCGDPSRTDGQVSGSRLPFLGPKQVIYADGATGGDVGQVDFADWEPSSAARKLVFLWPDGSELDARAEGYIDDYHFLSPNGDIDEQLMLLAITDGTQIPVVARAVLVNP